MILIFKACKPDEKELLDSLIVYNKETKTHKLAGALEHKALHGEYHSQFHNIHVMYRGVHLTFERANLVLSKHQNFFNFISGPKCMFLIIYRTNF